MLQENLTSRQKVKILIIEDNDFDFELVERKLQSINFSFEARRAIVEEEFNQHLLQFRPDLILSDFSLPTFSGLEALSIAKKHNPLTPFIFVTGTLGEELAVETMIQGANDYVLKDSLHKLEPAITRVLNEVKEKQKREEAENKLKIKVEELKSLVYRISHDIRGPICSVKGILNLIQHSESNSIKDITEYVNIISQVNRKMEGIVLNLSSFQFIYNDDIKLDDIDLDLFFEKLGSAISEIENYKEVGLKLTYKGQQYFRSEFNLLFSVFFNLIHNAIVFMDKNKSERKVICSAEVSETGLSLQVEDNGIGIEKYIQDKVFGMFFRGSNLSKGAGLGLYITKTILDRLNGTITLISNEKEGTRINIFIPTISSSQPRNWINN
ncbi:response regulator receiver sensor signal transduction histidine kinase [Sporocytophaga myxococcoides]|uniref:histidine kinase n=1 Tax=Sporocytophaga myxococcoides TaxID=153721 RepID=A0A098L9Z4_9BACT|nr:HAMP domain-containing sensor histidine kinase [Sporocytophaga myxococcoides]GAL83148.1 response regulator receiver sensor signal transduction histidine kinase [Sporocytophaga myxococcoides]